MTDEYRQWLAAQMVRRYFGIHAFSPESGSLGSVAAFNNRSASAIASSRFLSSGNIIGCCHKTSGSSGSSPVFFSVAFVSSRRISFSDALPRWEFECKLSSNFRSSASATADVIAGPTVKLGLFVGSAIRYILAKCLGLACANVPNLRKKRLHPHSVRHSTAVALLKSGVDLSTISHLLGHASPTTTNRYAKVDLEMKRQAIAKVKPVPRRSRTPWGKDRTILDWLESL